MNLVDSMTLYSKYLRIQAAKLDLETVGEKAEAVCERIQDLEHYPETTEKWCEAVEKAICETLEYINLCVYLCRNFGDGRNLIIPDVISVAVSLCELKNSISNRMYDSERRGELLDQLSEVLCDLGSSVVVQEEIYWLSISKLFDLDTDGSIAKALEIDKTIIESGGSVEDDDEEEDESSADKDDTESEAMKILREGCNRPEKVISTSWIQRRFGYGYGKSAKLLDWLEEKGYVQSYQDMKIEGLNGRRILVSENMFES